MRSFFTRSFISSLQALRASGGGCSSSQMRVTLCRGNRGNRMDYTQTIRAAFWQQVVRCRRRRRQLLPHPLMPLLPRLLLLLLLLLPLNLAWLVIRRVLRYPLANLVFRVRAAGAWSARYLLSPPPAAAWSVQSTVLWGLQRRQGHHRSAASVAAPGQWMARYAAPPSPAPLQDPSALPTTPLLDLARPPALHQTPQAAQGSSGSAAPAVVFCARAPVPVPGACHSLASGTRR